MITVDKISVQLGKSKVLQEVDFTLKPGKLTVLIGPNGAGKSTLLKSMASLLPLTSGQIRVGENDLRHLMPEERARLIAYLPQERSIAWDLKAIDIAALGAQNSPPETARVNAFAQLMAMGLQEVADKGVMSLSGGQRSRVLLARVLTSEAVIYLLDEPLIALDPAWQRQVLMILKARAAAGVSIILSLHDLHLAAQFSDEILIVNEGRLVAQGPAEALLTSDCLADVFRLRGQLVTEDGQTRLSLESEPLELVGLAVS